MEGKQVNDSDVLRGEFALHDGSYELATAQGNPMGHRLRHGLSPTPRPLPRLAP
jgi:hypothetical protein